MEFGTDYNHQDHDTYLQIQYQRSGSSSAFNDKSKIDLKKKSQVNQVLTVRADPSNRVPHKPRITKAPSQPGSIRINPTNRVPITFSRRITNRLHRQNPLQLQPRFRPLRHLQIRVQVHKARIRTAPRLPNPNHIRIRRTTGSKSTAQRRRLTRRSVPVRMAQTRRRTIQRRSQQRIRTVIIHDRVPARHVERQTAVQFDSLVNDIFCDARVWAQVRGTNHQPLDRRVDRSDWVCVV